MFVGFGLLFGVLVVLDCDFGCMGMWGRCFRPFGLILGLDGVPVLVWVFCDFGVSRDVVFWCLEFPGVFLLRWVF